MPQGASADLATFFSTPQLPGMATNAQLEYRAVAASRNGAAALASPVRNVLIASPPENNTAAPPAPNGLVAVPENSSVLLTWNAPPGADSPATAGYTVKQSANRAGPWSTVDGGAAIQASPSPSLRVAKLTNGQTYFFTVEAYNSSGDRSPPSPPAAATPRARGYLNHCGDISTDTTWSGDMEHVVTCPVTVAAGATLTVAAGAILDLDADLKVAGGLKLAGESDAPITVPYRGGVSAVRLTPTAVIRVDHSSGWLFWVDTADSVHIGASRLTSGASLRANRIDVDESVLDDATTIAGSDVRVTRTTTAALRVTMRSGTSSGLTVAGNTFTGGTGCALQVSSTQLVNPEPLRHNRATGSTYNALCLNGRLTENWTAAPEDPSLLPVVADTMQIPAGVTVTLAAGSIVRGTLALNGGSLIARGAAGTHPVLTGIDDRSLAQPGFFGQTWPWVDYPDIRSHVNGAASLFVLEGTRVQGDVNVDVTGQGTIANTEVNGTVSMRAQSATTPLHLTSSIVRGSVSLQGDGGTTDFSDNTVKPWIYPSTTTSYVLPPTVSVNNDYLGETKVRGNRIDGQHPAQPFPLSGSPAEQATLEVYISHYESYSPVRGNAVAPIVTDNEIDNTPRIALIVTAPQLSVQGLARNTGTGNLYDSMALEGRGLGSWTVSASELAPAVIQSGYANEGGLWFADGATWSLPAGTVVRSFSRSAGCSLGCHERVISPSISVDNLILNGTADAPVALGDNAGVFEGIYLDNVSGQHATFMNPAVYMSGGRVRLDHVSFIGMGLGSSAGISIANALRADTNEVLAADVQFDHAAINFTSSGPAIAVNLSNPSSTDDAPFLGRTAIRGSFRVAKSLLQTTNGAVTIAGDLALGSEHAAQVVEACTFASGKCSVDMRQFDWGSSAGPFITPGQPLACGAVSVSPWLGQAERASLWTVPDCGGSVIDPAGDIQTARSAFYSQLNPYQQACADPDTNIQDACAIVHTYATCLKSGLDIAATQAMWLGGPLSDANDIGQKIADGGSDYLIGQPDSFDTVLGYAYKAVSTFHTLLEVKIAYSSCANSGPR